MASTVGAPLIRLRVSFLLPLAPAISSAARTSSSPSSLCEEKSLFLFPFLFLFLGRSMEVKEGTCASLSSSRVAY